MKHEIPDWAEKIILPNELEANNTLSDLRQSLDKTKLLIKEQEDQLTLISRKKVLFFGFGNELEREVEIIFSFLGFDILSTEHNRDDLIIKHKDSVAVVEIKGLTGSAAEKNAIQLEKWRLLYAENNDILPKGILVVNSYRNTPISTRKEATFPDQMLKFSQGREHCLITTLQLLALYYEVQSSPEKKEKIVASLFETTGIYNSHYRLEKFIKLK